MKSIRKPFAALILAFVLSLTALGGDQNSPGAVPPPPDDDGDSIRIEMTVDTPEYQAQGLTEDASSIWGDLLNAIYSLF